MKSLQETIALLQKEISAALDTQAPGWEAQRVTLSLEVALGPEGKPLAVRSNAGEAAGDRPGHRVTIEFKVGGPPTESLEATKPEVQSAPTTGKGASPRERVIAELTTLFGAPGFDSSARAAVFCEVMQGLDPEQATSLGAALSRPAREIADEGLRRARHLILGMVQSGPLKSADRASVLLASLLEKWTPPELVGLIEERWKTQERWMN